MRTIKKQDVILFLLATLAGFGLHSLYRLAPVWPAALLAPARESIWEHLKLLFWPYLAASLYLRLRTGRPLLPRLLVLLGLCAAMLGLSFWYHILLGGDAVGADIALFVGLMALGFVLPAFLNGPHTGKKWELVLALTVALTALILIFTFFPPDNLLFTDLTGANTWSRLPC